MKTSPANGRDGNSTERNTDAADQPGSMASPSSGQRRLWFVQQLDPQSPVYNVPYLIRLRGELKPRALQRALDTMVERHDVLRTTFTAVDGEPVQTVQPLWSIDLQLTDLTSLPADEREGELTWRTAELARKAFDLARDLMVRVHLFRLAPQEHALMLVLHHIAADGWSMATLYLELGACYAAFAQGRSPELPPLPMRYADFAAWQHESLQGETVDRLVAHWRTYLDGAPPLLELPSDHPRPSVRSHLGATVESRLPAGLVAGLRALGSANGATLFMTLLGGFDVLLHRGTGRTDIIVGSPMGGRSLPETEGLIGFFVNTLALRTRLDGDPTVRELLARVREAVITAFEGRELPFERLIAALQPPRDVRFDPICQIYFALQNMPTTPLVFNGVSLTMAPVYTGTAKCDLNVWAAEQPDDSVEITAEYASDLFVGQTIRQLLRHYEFLLGALVAEPGARLSELPPYRPNNEPAEPGTGAAGGPARCGQSTARPVVGPDKEARRPQPSPERNAQPGPPAAWFVEETVATIWKEILRRDDVGYDDNFFDSGGHSLRLMQVQGRIRDTLGIDLPVLKLFQFPTIHRLAMHLVEIKAATSGETHGLQPEGHEGVRNAAGVRAASARSTHGEPMP